MRTPGQTLQRLLLCAACVACLAVAAPASAGKSQPGAVSCVIFAPEFIDAGYPFTVKIVRQPSYPGSWVAPLVDASVAITRADGGQMVTTYSETSSRYGYGVTYVYAVLQAPSCNGSASCVIDTRVPAVITAVIREPVSRGNKVSYRETQCEPATAFVNPSA
jgi:hypothetical protein